MRCLLHATLVAVVLPYVLVIRLVVRCVTYFLCSRRVLAARSACRSVRSAFSESAKVHRVVFALQRAGLEARLSSQQEEHKQLEARYAKLKQALADHDKACILLRLLAACRRLRCLRL